MLEVYGCIVSEHNPAYAGLAMAICILSMFTAFLLARHIESFETARRARWVVTVGYVTGLGIWSTHFIAMLAYQPGMPTSYAPLGTIWSFIIAVVLSCAGWWLYSSPRKFGGLLGAGTTTAGIAAMHIVGMSALKTRGEFHYDLRFLAGAVLIAGLFAAAALHLRRGRLPRFPAAQALLLALATCVLHFGAMAAVTIFPVGNVEIPAETISREVMTMGVGFSVLIQIALAVFAVVLEVRVKSTVAEVSRTMSRDPVTDLLNVSAFEREGVALMSARGANGGGYALARIELDGLGKIHENHGREVANQALIALARRLSAHCGSGLAGRAGGDEFIAFLRHEEPTQWSDPQLTAIVRALSEPIEIEGKLLKVAVRVGVAHFPAQALDWDDLRRKAGFALHHAGFSGLTSCLEYDAGMEQQAAEQQALEAALRDAIPGCQLAVHYQPIACLQTGGVVGFEALLRWQHPELGTVPPARFIPLAEAAGLMVDIGDWVLRNACTTAARWSQPLKVAVNLSAAQFVDGNLVARIRSALIDSGLPADRLELEITEGLFIEEGEGAVEVLRQIKALGVRIAMDDFGTGFSSLGYFRRFPFDKVKIDQSFVRDMIANRQSMAIVKAVIRLGRALDLIVLAEGVETEQQRDILAIEGCHQIQGYWLGKPAPAESFGSLTHRVSTRSHPCANSCDECLERLRPPCGYETGGKMSFHVTRGEGPIAA